MLGTSQLKTPPPIVYDLDTFVENVLLHERIVTPEQVEEAKKLVAEYPGSNLIDGLINVGALNATVARNVWADYRKWSAQMAGKTQAPTASTDASDADSLEASDSAESLEDSGTASDASVPPPPPPPKPVMSASAPTTDDGFGTPPRAMPKKFAATGIHKASTAQSGRAYLEMHENQPATPLPRAHKKRSTAIIVKKGSDKGAELGKILGQARQLGGSDVHIKPGVPPILRKTKQLSFFGQKLTAEQTEKVLLSILTVDQRETLEELKSLEFSYTIEGQGRYRACLSRQRLGWEGSFRILQNRVPTFEELGLPEQLKRLTDYHQGLVLITGPSGSGKSTTLAAMLELINQKRDEHIITVEDPIEYVFEAKRCQINQRQVGLHTDSFSTALRAMLREDPNVIMIGELRDLETTSLAISAAETGHLVFGTLDTTSAPRTIDRIINTFPRDEQDQVRRMISESIRGIVCQQLLPRKDGQGMVLALEILFNTSAIGNLIREAKLHQVEQTMQVSKNIGMVIMDNHLQNLVLQEIVDGTEAYFAATDKTKFEMFAPQF